MIYLDTHAIIWLFDNMTERFGKAALKAIETEEVYCSPVCELELEYLSETKRIKEDARTITSDLEVRIGLKICDRPFEQVIARALKESWTRDPFDRIITAQAHLRDARLVTKDRTIHKNYSKALWD